MGGKQAEAGECLWLEPEGNVDVCKERGSSRCVFWAKGAEFSCFVPDIDLSLDFL
jgi:hypothetical protein